MRSAAVIVDPYGQNNDDDYEYHGTDYYRSKITRHTLVSGGRRTFIRASCLKRVFSHHILFVESKIARNGAYKAAVEGSSRKTVPLFIFKSFEEARADARCGGDLFQRHATQFAFSLQVVTERRRRHSIPEYLG